MKRSTILLTGGTLGLVLILFGAMVVFRLSSAPGAQPPATRSVDIQLPGQGITTLEPLPGATLPVRLGTFKYLSTVGSWKVRLVPGEPGAGTLKVPLTDRFHIGLQVEGDYLIVNSEDRPGSFSWTGSGEPELDLCGPELTEFRTTGSSDLALDNLKVGSLTVRLSGASRLSGSGSVGNLRIRASGTSDVAFDGVTARDVEVEGSGAGNLAVRSDGGRVEGSLSGAVNLRVGGTPSAVNVITSGLSAVTRN